MQTLWRWGRGTVPTAAAQKRLAEIAAEHGLVLPPWTRVRRPRRPRALIPLAERFWAKVDKNGPVPAHRPDLGPCWLWIAGLDEHGYGRINVDAVAVGAHVVAYRLEHGAVPDGLFVLHHCNNPQCVRHSHLYAGTQKQNMADRDRVGHHGLKLHPERAARGERNGASTLSDAQVADIRAATGLQREIAKRFKVSQAHISRIRRKEQR